MLGQTFGGRYRVTQALGAGGFGRTYVAEDTQRPGSPHCVLKQLRFDSPDPHLLQQVRRMFTQEAETLEKLGEHDQIPRLLASFEENNEFYLVQELIEGQSLNETLKPGYQLHEAEVVALLDDVLGILEFVHSQQVIHRDIKPENLIRRSKDHRLVLIDFGAVKTIDTLTRPIETAAQIAPSIPVYTTGYAASEQCLGQPRYSSDLYSLGVIGIQALTGQHPSQLNYNPTCQLEWQDQAPGVNDRLAAILNQMTQFHFNDRYANATQVRKALKGVMVPPTRLMLPGEATAFGPATSSREDPAAAQKPLPWKWIAGAAAVSAVAGGIWQWQPSPQLPSSPNLAASVRQQISSGERVLNNDDSPSKQNATEHMAAGQPVAAIAALEKARRRDPNDPEALIYLNNARIGKKPSYAIAAVLPLTTQAKTANEVLRGIAQVQDQINQSGGIQGKALKVVLADDQNKPEMAKQVAQALVQDPTVLGVVGHGSSDATLAAAEVYKAGELVAIAPLSSAVKLSGFSPYLFRTMPSDQLPAKQLADYVTNKLKKKRLAILFNSSNTYSKSLKEEFKNAFFYANQGEVVSEIDVNEADFDAADSLKTLTQKKAEVIFLAINGDKLDQALLLAQLNANRLPLIGGDALYSSKTLKIGGKTMSSLVIAVPVQQISLDESRFQAQAKKLWGESVSWRSALAFDATRALITGLTQADSRRGLQTILSNPQFHAVGATQPVKFLDTGDRKGAIQLLRLAPDKTGNAFKPLP
jgi:eukaryotic-like serine/threonine-protein kinase